MLNLVLPDRWNELDSPLHRLDPRSKLLSLAALVLFLTLSQQHLTLKLPLAAAYLVALAVISRVPVGYTLKRAALVLPFPLIAVLTALLAEQLPGGPGFTAERGAAIVSKAYLAAIAVLLLVTTTRLPDLLRALAAIRVPALLLTTVHFVYRYLFLISAESQRMRQARWSRGASRLRWSAAGSALAVLFIRSYARAERIHQAMLARGFHGLLPASGAFHWRWRDTAFVAAMIVFLAAAYMLPRQVLPR